MTTETPEKENANEPRLRRAGFLRLAHSANDALQVTPFWPWVRTFWILLVRPVERFYTDGTSTYAGNVAFFSLLAMFPFLIFVAAVASFFNEDAALIALLNRLISELPPITANLIEPNIKAAVGNNSGSLLTFGMLGALWVASSAVETLRTGLNRAYRVFDGRNYFFHRAKGILVVIIISIMIASYIGLNFLVPIVLEWFRDEPEIRSRMEGIYDVGRWMLPLVLISINAALHRFLAYMDYTWLEILPGAALSFLLWTFLVSFFVTYVQSAMGFSAVYGGLGGIIVLLLFFYLSATTFLLGAEFNAVLKTEVRGHEH